MHLVTFAYRFLSSDHIKIQIKLFRSRSMIDVCLLAICSFLFWSVNSTIISDICIDMLHWLIHRVAAAALMFHERNLPLVIVCPPFEAGNKGLDPPMVDVLAGSEELELTWSQANNFEVLIYVTYLFRAGKRLFRFLSLNSLIWIKTDAQVMSFWVVRGKVILSFRVEWREMVKGNKTNWLFLLTSLVGPNWWKIESWNIIVGYYLLWVLDSTKYR